MGLVADRSVADVLVLRLDRPARRNALDLALVGALLDAFDDVSARAVVLGSTDADCFCAGADLTIPDADRAIVSDRLYELYGRMIGLAAPVVTAIGGHAVGAGAQLALASDLRVAGPNAAFRFTGVGHGLAVGSWALPSLVGRGRALDLCTTVRTVAADEGLRIGLVDRVTDDPLDAAVALARSFASLDEAALARVKAIVRDVTHLAPALAQERAQNRAAWSGAAPRRWHAT